MQAITIAGGNLFRVSAECLNDATQWLRIAQLNNINDPFLNGITTLLIPDPGANEGGGVASQ